MSNQIEKNAEYYENYKKQLSEMIFKKSNGQIPKRVCDRLAGNRTTHKKHTDSQGEKEKSMEELAFDCISAYFA